MKFIIGICLLFMLSIGSVSAVPSLSAPKTEATKSESSSFLQPIKLKIFKWNAEINRQVQKRMKALKDHPTPAVILSAVFAAFLYGVLHTLGPGHGKMVVASYFMTHGARFWRGIFVGAQIAFSHVAGAVFLVLTTDFAMRQILANTDQALYWMRTISFSLIFLIGLYMFWRAWRHAFGKEVSSSCSHCNHGHHEHDETSQKHQSRREAVMSWIVGAVPCTGSLLILLYSMAHDVLYLGLLMVFFVALGMAVTVTIIGWVCIFGKQHIVDRYFTLGGSGHKLQISLEVLGSVMIMFIGATLFIAINL